MTNDYFEVCLFTLLAVSLVSLVYMDTSPGSVDESSN